MLFLPARFKNPIFLSVGVLLLLGIILAFGMPLSKKVPPVPPINFEELEFPTLVKNRLLRNAQAAVSEKDSTKRFELYQDNLIIFLNRYQATHDPKIRTQAQILAQFLADEFPDEFQANQQALAIPCLDVGCGTPDYPVQIEAIKTEVGLLTTIDPRVGEAVLKKFEEAALSQDQDKQAEAYFHAFQMLAGEYGRTKDKKIAQTANSLKDFMESQYPQYSQQLAINFPEIFKN